MKLNCQDVSYLAGVDANMDCGSVGLFSLDTLNVDDILLPVDLHHFANLLAFVVSTDNLFVNKMRLRVHLSILVLDSI